MDGLIGKMDEAYEDHLKQLMALLFRIVSQIGKK